MESELHIAVIEGQHDKVRFLLSCGADIHSTFRHPNSYLYFVRIYEISWDRFRNFPLQYASEKGDLAMVQLLLENGADPQQDNHLSLVSACKEGHLAIVKQLLESGAQVIHGMGIESPYLPYEACSKHRLDILEVLVQYGLCLNEDYIVYAMEIDETEKIRFLLEKNYLDQSLMYRVMLTAVDNALEDMKRLIAAFKQGIWTEEASHLYIKGFQHAFLLSVDKNNTDMACLLLTVHEQVDLDLTTAFRRCMSMENYDIAKHLLDYGVDPNGPSFTFAIPTTLLSDYCKKGNHSAIQFLLNTCLKQLHLDLDKNMQLARDNGHVKSVKLLEQVAFRQHAKTNQFIYSQ
jgi:ankyrin repeat protein